MICVQGCRLTTDEHDICRDATGKPRVILPDGKTVRSYARASSFGDPLDDKGGLIAWSQANALRGALTDAAIGERFLAVDDGWVTVEAKTATKAVIAEAAIVGGAEVKANRGTDIHGWSEQLDKGEPIIGLRAEHEADLMAYEFATEGMQHLVIEEFCVVDDLRVGGTPDRISYYPEPCATCGRTTRVVDLKTGSVGFPGKMSVQLGLYAHALRYVQSEGDDGLAYGLRTELPEVCPHEGIIINLPAGSGQATLFWLDIDAGWKQAIGDAAGGIPGVKAWRSNQKKLLRPVAA